MSNSIYTINAPSGIFILGKNYAFGDTVTLSDAQAKYLVYSGNISLAGVSPATPVDQPTLNNTFVQVVTNGIAQNISLAQFLSYLPGWQAEIGTIPNFVAQSYVDALVSDARSNLNTQISALATSLNAKITALGSGTLPTLSALSLSSISATINASYSASISGLTANSTRTATSSDGTALSIVGSTLSGTFTTQGSKTITIVETLLASNNSPKTSTFTISVANAGTPAPSSSPGGGPNNTADFSDSNNAYLVAALVA